MEQAAAIGGDVLVVAIATAEKGAELVVGSTEPIRGVECLEAAHTSDPAFHAPMILLQPIVLIGAGSVLDVSAQRRTDRARIGAVSVRGDAVRDHAGGELRGAKECLRRRPVAMLGEHGINQIAIAVDRTVEIAPVAANLQIRLIDVPRPASSASPTTTPWSQLIGQNGREFRFPVADGLVAEDDAALEEHLAEVVQREAVAQAPEHHERDDVARILGPVQHAAAALIELPAAVAAAKAPVALRRAIPPLRGGRRATVDAFHPGLLG